MCLIGFLSLLRRGIDELLVSVSDEVRLPLARSGCIAGGGSSHRLHSWRRTRCCHSSSISSQLRGAWWQNRDIYEALRSSTK